MDDPFYPIAWQEDHSGMQGTTYLDEHTGGYLNSSFHNDFSGRDILNGVWAGSKENFECDRPDGSALYHMVETSKELSEYKATKQLCNRLLEPFMWHTAIITSSEWDNFFHLRCPKYIIDGPWKTPSEYRSRKQAIENHNVKEYTKNWTDLDWMKVNVGQGEIHIMALAEAIWDAMRESQARILRPGEWHIPFGDKIDLDRLSPQTYNDVREIDTPTHFIAVPSVMASMMIATARCARVSYLNFEGKDDYVEDIKLYERLLKSGHFSPFEHCAKAMSEEDYDKNLRIELGKVQPGWCRNFKGFIQLRALLEV